MWIEFFCVDTKRSLFLCKLDAIFKKWGFSFCAFFCYSEFWREKKLCDFFKVPFFTPLLVFMVGRCVSLSCVCAMRGYSTLFLFFACFAVFPVSNSQV